MGFRSFAIVPAAGSSRRMGAPKLMLPLAGRPLVEHVLTAWTASRVTRTVVVVRSTDQALAEVGRRFDVDLVTPPHAPRQMKESVALALQHIDDCYAPKPRDVWLVAPADLPGLSRQAIDAVIGAHEPDDPQAVVPTFAGRRGHPLLMPWSVAADVSRLGRDEGVNSLLARMRIREIVWAEPAMLADVDTPADYARLT